MGVVDAATRLASQFERDTGLALRGSGEQRACRACTVRVSYHEGAPAQRHHAADCPVLALPRIVAALAAAERVLERMRDAEPSEPTACPRHLDGTYALCGRPIGEHAPDCPWQALVAALAEDAPP